MSGRMGKGELHSGYQNPNVAPETSRRCCSLGSPRETDEMDNAAALHKVLDGFRSGTRTERDKERPSTGW